MTILALVAVGIPLWMAAAAGAIGLPSNDDWVYMRAATGLFQTGSVDLFAHTAAFIGQLLTVQPFLWVSGGDPWAFTAYGLVMASIGVVATYLLARRFLGIASAVFVVLLTQAMPGFVRQSASFMTDGPTFAFVMVCLYLGTKWLQGDGGRWTLMVSIGIGLLAVGIREFAISAPVAILAVAWVRSRAGERTLLAFVSMVLVVGVATIIGVVASLPGNVQPVSVHSQYLSILGPAFITLAAVVLPAAVLWAGERIGAISPHAILLAAAAVGLMVALSPNGPIIGNLWTSNGLGGGYIGPGGYYEGPTGDFFLTGSRETVFGSTSWALSEQLAIFAAILVGALILTRGKHHVIGVTNLSTAKAFVVRFAHAPEAPLLLFLLLYGAELALYSAIGAVYDRYLFPMVPVVATLMLRRGSQPFALGRSHAFAHGAFVWLVASAFIIALNSFAYDTARYREGQAAVAMGYDASTVDAGYEWVGFNGTGPEKTDSIRTA